MDDLNSRWWGRLAVLPMFIARAMAANAANAILRVARTGNNDSVPFCLLLEMSTVRMEHSIQE